ncbi:MAG: putative CtpA-like serine protease [Syntrophorhabdus sp. PtaU1.Bin058]|nr:MAG: putative CtpA-like serine protease [Syntrophorhabdus sp. PtaU1.Bin058]
MRPYRLLNISCVVLLIAALVFPFTSFGGADSQIPKYEPKTASYRDIQLLANALSMVQMASREDVDKRAFLYSALDGMAKALDRYSYFVPPGMAGVFMNSMRDRYIGIGIDIARTDDGNIEVVSTVPGGPASKAGLRPKDIIVSIDGKQITKMKFIEALKLLSDIGFSVGSKVRLSVRHKDTDNLLDFTVTRDFIQLKTIEWRILDSHYGYVRLTGFYKDTVTDFKKAIYEMEAKAPALKGLLIDLRNNPGGDAESSFELSRMFLNPGTIVSFESNFPGYNVKIAANGEPTYKRPVVIIVNEGSASASELFSGAMQFNNRAKLIGRRTYGKNAVQNFVPISDDAGLYLTIGHFFLPGGVSIEGKGLIPDLPIDQNTGEEELLSKAIQLIKKCE